MHPERSLDNAVWHSLTTTQADVAERHGSAARFRTDVNVFGAVERCDDGGWSDLATLVGAGGLAVLFRDEVPEPPEGWAVIQRGPGYQMTLPAGPPVVPLDPAVVVRVLDANEPGDVDAMVALTTLTEPGPFLPGTASLGRYVGAFAGDHLVAMAGERMHLPGWTEVSAVCTHPDWRGRGLAAALTCTVAEGIVRRDERAFLHVAGNNPGAKRVYERIGFELRRIVTWAAVTAPS